MMMMDYYQLVESSSSCQDSLKLLEGDIHHANMLAAAIPISKGGACLQMKLVYNPLAPVYLFLLQWMNCSCKCLFPSYLNLFHILVSKVSRNGKKMFTSHGRKATITEFYTVILPSLQRLHDTTSELDINQDEGQGLEMIIRKKLGEKRNHSVADFERDDECGICLVPCTKMVLPNCCHEMCINCYRDWSTKSKSCPFCRGSLKRVNSEDLWVLTCSGDVVDQETVSREDMLRFYLYINSLPKDIPDTHFLLYYEYLI